MLGVNWFCGEGSRGTRRGAEGQQGGSRSAARRGEGAPPRRPQPLAPLRAPGAGKLSLPWREPAGRARATGTVLRRAGG